MPVSMSRLLVEVIVLWNCSRCHGEAHVDLDAAVLRRSGEDCQAFPLVQAVCDRAYHVGPQSESTLVRARPMPVGSARLFVHLF